MTTTPFSRAAAGHEAQPTIEQGVPGSAGQRDEGDFRLLIADRYEVVNTQTGGMALVHLCRDQRTNDLVALKTFKPEFLPNRAARDLFLREGTTWVQLGQHPHIVPAYRVERIGDGRELYLVLEWVVQPPDRRKPSLRSWMYPGQPLPVDTAVLFALHIARGMNYATQKIPGLIHCDLKPENVLVDFDGNARITDFGLARSLLGLGSGVLTSLPDTTDHFTRTQITQGVAGTPLYMAPEQWLSQPIDPRADIYALGCILYEMLTGRYAAQGKSRSALKAAHVEGKIQPPPNTLLPELVAFLQHSMMTRRTRRIRSWSEVESTLAAIYELVTGSPPPPVKQTTAVTRDERLAMGRSYNMMGRSYLDIGKLPVAITYFEQAVWLGRQEKSLELEASSLGYLGQAYSAAGYSGRAIDFYQEQLAIARETGSQAEAAAALGNLGTSYRYRDELDKAISYHKQELTLTRGLSDQYGEAAALYHLGDAYRRLGKWHQASKLHQQSLTLARQLEDQVRIRSVLRGMGRIFQATNQPNEALALLIQSLKIAQKLGDRMGEGESLSDIANLYRQLGYDLKAIEYYHKALHIAEENSDWRGLGRALRHLGDLHLQLGHATEAVTHYQRGLAAAIEIGNQEQERHVLAGLAQACFTLGDYMESAQLQRRVLRLAREQGNVTAQKEAALALGHAYRRWGDLGRTARYYEQYLALARQQQDEANQIEMLETLADVYVQSKQHKPARPLYEQCLAHLNESGLLDDRIRVMGKLGDTLLALLEFKAAADLYKLGVSAAHEASLPLAEADLLSRLALVQYRLGSRWRAARTADKALKLVGDDRETAAAAGVAFRVANLYMKRRKWPQAALLARQALAAFKALDDQEMIDTLQLMLNDIEQAQESRRGFLF